MTKKLLSLALALLMLTASCAALAEENVIVFDENSVAELAGGFYELQGLGLQMWIPDALVGVELTDEQIEAGYYATFATEDASCVFTIGSMTLQDGAGNALTDYESIAASLPEGGATQVEQGVINGLACLSFVYEEQSTMGVLFVADDGSAISFTFAPMSDENYLPIASVMVSSIMAVE